MQVDAAAGGLRCRRCTAVVTPAQLQRGCAGVQGDGNPLARICTRGKRSVRRSLLVRPGLLWECTGHFSCKLTHAPISSCSSSHIENNEARDTLQAGWLPTASGVRAVGICITNRLT
jgi:hypothetical protein